MLISNVKLFRQHRTWQSSASSPQYSSVAPTTSREVIHSRTKMSSAACIFCKIIKGEYSGAELETTTFEQPTMKVCML